jgi:hypothetical protein
MAKALLWRRRVGMRFAPKSTILETFVNSAVYGANLIPGPSLEEKGVGIHHPARLVVVGLLSS